MFFILVVCSILFVLFRTEIMKIFINNSGVVNEGANLVMIEVPFFGIFSGIVALFRGSGHNVPTMILDISRLWALRIPLAYLLGMNSTGVWIGMALSNIVGTVIALIFFETGIWKKKVID